jgi:carbonic anhydrase
MLILIVAAALASPTLATSANPGISADEAMRLLKEGNARYVDGKLQHPHQGPERRALTSGQGQHPLAAVLTCSDSRVPPEIIFDQGIGDLFVVRVAGNVAATDEVGSIEYAVEHLGAPVVVVLGHTQCAAVGAVLDGAKLPPNIANLVEPIKPAVDKAREANPQAAKDVLLKAAITANVWQALEDMLRLSPIIREKVRDGQVKLVAALYDLDSGQVQWLGPHPDQEKLVGAKKGAGKTGKKEKKTKKLGE